jgi:hypothetical protein
MVILDLWGKEGWLAWLVGSLIDDYLIGLFKMRLWRL